MKTKLAEQPDDSLVAEKARLLEWAKGLINKEKLAEAIYEFIDESEDIYIRPNEGVKLKVEIISDLENVIETESEVTK